MRDRSYLDALILVAKPLTEEFDPPWNYIRSVFWGVLPMAFLSFAISAVIDQTPEYLRIRNFFFNLGLISTGIDLILYCACAYQAYQIALARDYEKGERVRRFQD